MKEFPRKNRHDSSECKLVNNTAYFKDGCRNGLTAMLQNVEPLRASFNMSRSRAENGRNTTTRMSRSKN